MLATHTPIQVISNRAIALPLLSKVPAGFPSPAEDFLDRRLDIGAELVKHPEATFLLRISGRSMEQLGIFDGDIVIVDRAIEPQHGHIVIAVVDGEFTCKQLYARDGQVKLVAGNPEYPDIVMQDMQTLEVWGVVTSTIRRFVV